MVDDTTNLGNDFANLSLEDLQARLAQMEGRELNQTEQNQLDLILSRIKLLQAQEDRKPVNLSNSSQRQAPPLGLRTDPVALSRALKDKKLKLNIDTPTIDMDKEYRKSITTLSAEELKARIEDMEKEGTTRTGQRHLSILRNRLIELTNPKPKTNKEQKPSETHGFDPKLLEAMFLESQLRSGNVRPKDVIHYINTLDEKGREQYAAYQQTLDHLHNLQWINPGNSEHDGEWATVNRELAYDQMRRTAQLGGKSVDAHPINLEGNRVSNIHGRSRIGAEKAEAPLFVQNASQAARYANEETPHDLDIEKLKFLLTDSMTKSGSGTPKYLDKYLSGLSEKGREELEKYKERLQNEKSDTSLTYFSMLEASKHRQNKNEFGRSEERSGKLDNITQSNALEIYKQGVKGLPPSYLWSLRQGLAAHKHNLEAERANIQLENTVVQKVNQLNSQKITLFDIDQTFALKELLEDIQKHPLSSTTSSQMENIDRVLKLTSDEIQNFENQYGLSTDLRQSPEIVNRNISQLSAMPKNSELFARDVKPEALVRPSTLQSVKILLNNFKGNEATPSLAVLAGALQCRDIDSVQKDKLLELTLKRVKETTKLSQSEFANFEFLLHSLEQTKLPGAYSTAAKQKNMLAKARDTYLKASPLKEKQYQDIFNVLNNLKIKGDLQLTGRKTLSQKGSDSDIALFAEQVRNETEMYLANTSPKGITPKAFKEEYAERLRNNIIQLVYADKISKGEITAKDFGKAFESLAQSAQSKKPFKINQTSCIGYQAAKTNRISGAAKHLGENKGYENASRTFTDRIKATDNKLATKYGKTYSFLKNGLKSFGWGTAYSLGAAFGPAGIAAVAGASFANQAYGIYKDYKRTKAENPNLNIWSYMKQNKLRMAGALMSAASVVIGGSNLGADATIRLARAGSGIALAASGAFHQASQAYKAKKGNRWQKMWAATKAFGTSAANFAVGMALGQAAGANVSNVEQLLSNETSPADYTADYQAETPSNTFETSQINTMEPTVHQEQMPQLNQTEQNHMTPKIEEPPVANHDPVYKSETDLSPIANHDPVYKDNTPPSHALGDYSAEIQRQEGIGIDPEKINVELNAGVKPLEADNSPLPHYNNQEDPNIEVNKIKINDDDIKIVGQEDGNRIVLHLNDTDINDIDKIKFHNDGSVSVRMENEAGETVKFRINEDGKFDTYRVGGHSYTPEELSALNNNPETIAMNQENFQNLQTLRDSAAQEIGARDQTTIQSNQTGTNTLAQEQEAAAQETTPAAANPTQTEATQESAPVEADKPAESTPSETSLEQAPEQEAAAQETTPAAANPQTEVAQESASTEADKPAESTPSETSLEQAPEQEGSAQETTPAAANQTQAEADKESAQSHEQSGDNQASVPNEPPVHTTSSGLQYSFRDDGSMSIQGNSGDVSNLLPDTHIRDANGVYHMGEASATDPSLVEKIQMQNLREISLEDQVYQDIVNRQETGDTLNSHEQEFKQNHEQRLERNGLTHSEDGSLRHLTKEEMIAQKRGLNPTQSSSHTAAGSARTLLDGLKLKTVGDSTR